MKQRTSMAETPGIPRKEIQTARVHNELEALECFINGYFSVEMFLFNLKNNP